MFPTVFSALLTWTLTLPALASANSDSPTTLSFTRLANLGPTTSHALYQRDLLRAKSFKARTDPQKGSEPSKRAVIGTPADNEVVSYVATVGVGSPPTEYSLIIDTGSSNTWVGASSPYVKTKTSVDTGDAVSVMYGSGGFNGTEYLDMVTLGPGLTIKDQSIGVAKSSVGFHSGVDGILGIGPLVLTINTLPAHTDELIPTVTDNLFTKRTISSHSIGISFAPFNNQSGRSGELAWGGVDRSKFFGPITHVPITNTEPSRNYWGIDCSIHYGGILGLFSQDILSQTAGIVDTGTTLLLIATDAYQGYIKATHAVLDEEVGLLSLTPENFAILQTLHFKIGGFPFEFTPDAQRWPRALNTAVGGKPDGIYLIVGDIGFPSGSGLDFILGQVWLERFYSVYDSGKKQVGLAYTENTFSTSNEH